MKWLIEIAGWGGAALILGAYCLVSAGRLDGRSVAFQVMNVAGAAGFVINSGWNGAIPSAAMNVVWMLIGVYTLWRGRESGELRGRDRQA